MDALWLFVPVAAWTLYKVSSILTRLTRNRSRRSPLDQRRRVKAERHAVAASRVRFVPSDDGGVR